MLLCLCMMAGMLCNLGGWAEAVDNGYTQNIVSESRIADGSTMESYVGKLLSSDWGSRYAGRVWTDKSVFAYEDGDITLTNDLDGYDGSVHFDSDFGTVFSALTSSQVVHEYPPAPIDLVIALDMSASMAQDTRYAVDDSNYLSHSAGERSMAERIKNSRIQQTLDAVNGTIDALMKQNKENRVSVVVYGAGASVVMPLAHYARNDDKPYLTVSGMETLYSLDDLTLDGSEGWVWTRNRDACYTITADAMYSKRDNPVFSEHHTYTVSNNVDNRNPRTPKEDHITYTEIVKANPGYENQATADKTAFTSTKKQLAADEYVGYFTNTQGGIYLSYAQLAQSAETTFTAKMSTGEQVTVARIPAAIIMTDGGANFAFNAMDNWDKFYGVYHDAYSGGLNDGVSDFRNDNSTIDHTDPGKGWTQDKTDLSHRMGLDETYSDGRTERQVGDEWYNVYLPGQLGDTHKITSLYNKGVVEGNGTLDSAPGSERAGVFYSNDADPFGTGGTILQILLTASYMRYVTETHYENGWDNGHATAESRSNLLTYTMGVDSENVPQWGRLRLYPSMDPKNYFETTDHWNDAVLSNGPYDTHGWGSFQLTPDRYRPGLQKSVDGLENLLKNGTAKVTMKNGEKGDAIFDALPDGGYDDPRFHVKVTNQDVANNIAYADGFFDIDSSELVSKFQQILSEITGNVFIPISGDNDAGVGDSITYQDPLGEYMELKHGSITVDGEVAGSDKDTFDKDIFDMSMLLFGEMHGLVRAGVYDYQWNNDYMRNNETKEGYTGKKLDPDKDPLPIGWYKGDAKTAVYSYDEKGLPEGCNTAADAWANGWVLRFNYITLAEFVPISGIDVDTPPTKVPEQIQHSVYTCYRFADNQTERNRLRRNPVYGNEIPKELVEKWNAYYDENGSYPVGMDFYSSYPGVYRLSDIRVWSEHTGDYIDTAGAITPEDESGYDDSLYVNIPVSAVPTQLAEITLGADGPIAYKDNLDAKQQSTPFRLFYAVGLTEDLILRDSEGEQTGVDVSKISGEYIASHSDPDTGNISFISNWYSNTVYRGYASDDSTLGYSTRGDAAVSFSPDAKNRYYLFQKALPLIAHAYRVTNVGGDVAPVDNAGGKKWDANGGGNGKTKWEDGNTGGSSWDGGDFIGSYDTLESFKAALANKKQLIEGSKIWYIEDDKGYAYPLPEKITDAIITYTKDQLSKVDSDDAGAYTDGSNAFSSDDYFFLVIEYYLPMAGKGKDIDGKEVEGTHAVRKVNRMIARKGSAFGSGLASNNINNGDMLCWTDINGNCNLEIEYNSRTDTGDNTRGRPTLEKLTLKGADLRTYLRDQCKLSTAEDVEVRDSTGAITGHTSYLELDVAYWESVQADPHMATLIEEILAAENPQTRFDELFDWSVAARTGGIRVGAMYNNMQAKGGGGNLINGYYAGNFTHTANNFYVPTLSETSTAGAGLVINNYLGNNGRLEIANDNLIVTKTLVAPDGFKLTKEQEEKEKFAYQVFEQEMVGERLAQRLKWNPFSKSWQKRIESLDILTDNSSLLLDTNGKRALFCYQIGTPRQVVEVTEDGVSKYFYADESGAATDEECKECEGADNLDRLYYMYLPSNSSGDSNLTYHLFGSKYEGYKDKKGNDIGTTEPIEGAGTTAYYPVGTDTTGMADNDMQHFAQEKPGRTAGSREYWTNMAELIPYRNVYNAEHPMDSIDSSSEGIAVIAFEAESGSTRWDHDEDHNTELHIPLNDKEHPFTLVTVIPDPKGVESTVYSPFSSRTTYMTVPLYFGYNADLADHLKNDCEGGGSLANCTHASDYILTQDDLFDPDIGGLPSSGATNYVTQHTANFTLKSGEGLLLTGLGQNAYYRFTEKLTETQLAQAYMLKGIRQVTAGGEEDKTSKDFSSNAYSVFGTTDYFTEQNHYINTVDPELFVLTKSMVDRNDNNVTAAPDEEFTFTIVFESTDATAMTDMDSTLHYWKGKKDGLESNLTWTDGKGNEYQMPKKAPLLSDYEKYLTSKPGEERLAEITPVEGKPHTYEVKLKAQEAIVFYGLIAGTNFTVTEEKNDNYPVVESKGSLEGGYKQTGTIYRASEEPEAMNPVTTPNRADFTNRLESGILTVEKRIKGDDPDATRDFKFIATLSGAEIKPDDLKAVKYKADGTAYDASDFTLSWVEADGVWKADVTLHHGEQLLIEGIPLDTAYTVTETEKDGYNLQHVADNQDNNPDAEGNYLTLTDNRVEGTITSEKSQAYLLFVNEKAPYIPFTGGIGIVEITLIGALLIGIATTWIVLKKHKRRRNARIGG